MARTARQISNLVIDEISLVDKGANQHAVVTIAKNADGEQKENEMDIFDEQGNQLDVADLNEGDIVYDESGNAYSMEVDDESDVESDDNEDDLVGVEKARSTTAIAARAARRSQMKGKFREGLRAGQNARSATGAAFSGAAGRAGNFARTTGNSVGRNVSANRRAYGAGAGGLGVGALAGTGGAYAYNNRVQKSFADEVREELSKALTDADREEVITKALGEVGHLAEELEISKAMAEEERELRLEREYTEIAKSYNLPFEDEELGRVLRNCAEYLDEADCDIIHKAFSVAGEAIFEEYGAVGGGDNADVYSQVEAAMAEQVSKSGDYSLDEGIADFFYANPEAYDDYLAERGR